MRARVSPLARSVVCPSGSIRSLFVRCPCSVVVAAVCVRADFEEQEMESQEEYNQFFGVYRGALLQLITLMAEMEVGCGGTRRK